MEKLNQTDAGQLYYRLAFDRREEVDDGFGNAVGGWVEQFQRRARFVHMRGSETVLAARLESRNPMLAEVRKDSQTRQIDTDWQARDVRRDVAFNIRDIREDNNRSMIELFLESGVATG